MRDYVLVWFRFLSTFLGFCEWERERTCRIVRVYGLCKSAECLRCVCLIISVCTGDYNSNLSVWFNYVLTTTGPLCLVHLRFHSNWFVKTTYFGLALSHGTSFLALSHGSSLYTLLCSLSLPALLLFLSLSFSFSLSLSLCEL